MKAKRRYSTRRPASGRGALRALTAGALALGGVAGSARADAPPEQAQMGYSFSRYSEDSISRSRLAPGSEGDRYEIDMHQFSILSPLGRRFDLGFDLAHETMSGATPWFVIPDPVSGKPLQVMSGASTLAGNGTIDDKRTDLLLSSHYYLDSGKVGASVGFSTENDYESLNWGLSAERSFFSKNTTLSGGLGFSTDDIEPTDSDEFRDTLGNLTRPDKEDKRGLSASIGLTQLLGRMSTLQANLTFKRSSGYLSDPYKLVFIQDLGGIFADARPDQRKQWALALRYRRHFEGLIGSLHADYRFGWDDWGIRSHTFELAWNHNPWKGLRIVPSVRYYAQSAADFYSVYYVAARRDGYYSSDYRLSAYGALTFGVRAEATFRTPWTGQLPWIAAIALERYVSDGDYALVDVDLENPGLVSFTLLSASLNTLF
jgi:hypothetical protein